MARTVLVTGISRYVGARLASVLAADPDIERVIGVDTAPPPAAFFAADGVPLGRTEFVRVDLRSPDIAQVISSGDIETIVHMSLVSAPARAGGRVDMKEHNVIGTMQLLAACQRLPTVRRVVVRSTTAVYGSSPFDPAMFTEDAEPHSSPVSGYAKDAAEVEGYVRGFARRRPDVVVTMLRFANFLGTGVESPLTRYFAQPVLPTVLGFDPRLQFVHVDDGVEVLRRCALEDHPGTFNVAGEGVLLLSQCVRRAGRPKLPVVSPAFSMLGGVARRVGLIDFSPEQMGLMSHGRAVDTSRIAAELGWTPQYSTAAAFDDFLTSRGRGRNLQVELVDRLTELVGR